MIDMSSKIIGGANPPGISDTKPKAPETAAIESGGAAKAPAPPGMGTQVDKTA